MPKPVLKAFDGLPGVALVPKPVEGFSHHAELDDEVAGEVLGLVSTRFSCQRRRRAASSLPMMIRASEPPMKERRFSYDFVHNVALIDPLRFGLPGVSFEARETGPQGLENSRCRLHHTM
jgi:hypothetical protein